jgi:Protein of unknown function (DUF3168)
MAVEKGLFQLVTSNAAVQAAVGVDTNGTTRAFWDLAPQNTPMPFLIFDRVSTTDTYTMAGSTALRMGIFQITSYSDTTSGGYYTARAIANLVRDLLKDFKGTLPDTDATVVQAVLTYRDFDDKYSEGGKSFTFVTCLQFKVFYEG